MSPQYELSSTSIHEARRKNESVVVVRCRLGLGLPEDRHLSHLLAGGGMRPLLGDCPRGLADFPEFRYDNPAGINDRTGSDKARPQTPKHDADRCTYAAAPKQPPMIIACVSSEFDFAISLSQCFLSGCTSTDGQ